MAKVNKKKEIEDKNKVSEIKNNKEEAKKSIKEYIAKKNNRFEIFLKKKRGIEKIRRKEDFDFREAKINEYQKIVDQRRQEDNLLEEELLTLKFEEAIELANLKEKLNLKYEEYSILKNDEIIPFNENCDEKKEVNNNNEEKYLDIHFK